MCTNVHMCLSVRRVLMDYGGARVGRTAGFQCSGLTSEYTPKHPEAMTPGCPGTSCYSGPYHSRKRGAGKAHKKTTCFWCQRTIIHRRFYVTPTAPANLISRGSTYENDLWDFFESNCLGECDFSPIIHPVYYGHWDRAFPPFSWDPHLNNMSSKRWIFPGKSFVPLSNELWHAKRSLSRQLKISIHLTAQTEEDITGLNAAHVRRRSDF